MNTGSIAVLAAISRERGIECVMQFPKVVNIMRFKMFLENLRSSQPFDNIILCMDNLAIHKNREVQARMDELGFRWCYTPRYSPAYNGIEELWAASKAYIKKERLNAI